MTNSEVDVNIQPSQELSSLARWAFDARQAHSVALILAKTSLIPVDYRGKADEITAVILTGVEIGLQPMAALRSIALVEGIPALSAVALRGLVQAQGHSIWIDKATNTSVTAKGKRRGEDYIHESVWTIERASALGLTGRDQWRKQPKAMLIARATSEACRLVASDALVGMAYSLEELDDPVTPPTVNVRRKKTTPSVSVKSLEKNDPSLSGEVVLEVSESTDLVVNEILTEEN